MPKSALEAAGVAFAVVIDEFCLSPELELAAHVEQVEGGFEVAVDWFDDGDYEVRRVFVSCNGAPARLCRT